MPALIAPDPWASLRASLRHVPTTRGSLHTPALGLPGFPAASSGDMGETTAVAATPALVRRESLQGTQSHGKQVTEQCSSPSTAQSGPCELRTVCKMKPNKKLDPPALRAMAVLAQSSACARRMETIATLSWSGRGPPPDSRLALVRYPRGTDRNSPAHAMQTPLKFEPLPVKAAWNE